MLRSVIHEDDVSKLHIDRISNKKTRLKYTIYFLSLNDINLQK